MVFELFTQNVRNCEVTIVGDTTPGEAAHNLDHYPFRKMKKSQEQYML